MYRPRYYGQAEPEQQIPAPTQTSAQAMLRKAAGKRIATISTHPEYFAEGVRTTTKDQVGNAIAQGSAWRNNLMAAMDAGSWEAGLQRTGTEGWRQAAIEKSQNWVTGATSPTSQARYEQNFAPIVETIAATMPMLPLRVVPVSGDENVERVAMLNRAVHQAAQAMKAPIGTRGVYAPQPYMQPESPYSYSRAKAGAYTYPQRSQQRATAPQYYGRRY